MHALHGHDQSVRSQHEHEQGCEHDRQMNVSLMQSIRLHSDLRLAHSRKFRSRHTTSGMFESTILCPTNLPVASTRSLTLTLFTLALETSACNAGQDKHVHEDGMSSEK